MFSADSEVIAAAAAVFQWPGIRFFFSEGVKKLANRNAVCVER